MSKNYLDFLEREFISANIKDKERIEKLESDSLIKELSDWILEQQKTGKIYLDLLKKMELNYDSEDSVELYKSDFDTIVKDCRTRISPIAGEKIEGVADDRILRGQILISNNGPFIILNGEIIKLPVSYISTYMTQNTPLSIVNGFKSLHNREFCDIILGVYGSNSDTDKEYKLRELKKFKQDLRSQGLKEEYVTVNGKFMYVIASNNIKKKILVK